MPRIFETANLELSVYIYTDDHEPAHVHVFCGRKKDRNQANIKIALGSESIAPEVVSVKGDISNKTAIKALQLVAKYQEKFLEEWQKIHGKTMDN